MPSRLFLLFLTCAALGASGMISCSTVLDTAVPPSAEAPAPAPGGSSGGSSDTSSNTTNTSSGDPSSPAAPAAPAPISSPSSPPTNNPSPPKNSLTVVQLTDNLDEDHWGGNNTWPTTSRGRVLWQHQTASGDVDIFLGDDKGNAALLKTVPGFPDVDFMALGSGAGSDDLLASWRENLQTTFVDTGTGAPLSLGDHNQEENSIADGCLFFRDSTNGPINNEIARYRAAGGISTVSQTAYSDSEPVTSGCEAVWLRDGNLVHFDGSSIHPIETGPFSSFDFRDGRIAYSRGDDIFLHDTTTAGPAQNLTLNPSDLNRFPKTDGRFIAFIREIAAAQHEVVLYEIDSGTMKVISMTTDPKDGNSLEMDLGQVLWMEGADLYYYDGDSTHLINPAPATEVREPHLADGIVVWHGPTGTGTDEEVFLMK